jgi:hypothetical protein
MSISAEQEESSHTMYHAIAIERMSLEHHSKVTATFDPVRGFCVQIDLGHGHVFEHVLAAEDYEKGVLRDTLLHKRTIAQRDAEMKRQARAREAQELAAAHQRAQREAERLEAQAQEARSRAKEAVAARLREQQGQDAIAEAERLSAQSELALLAVASAARAADEAQRAAA